MKLTGTAHSPLVRIRWLACATFEIQADGISIVIDPFVGASPATPLTAECIEGADYVLLSHTHFDHVTDIKYLMDKFDAKVLCGQMAAHPLTRWLDCNPIKVYPMNAGLELDFGPAKVKALFGRHSDLHRTYSGCAEGCIPAALTKAGMSGPDSDEMQRIGPLEYTNFLITLKNGTRIAFYGGEDLPEARATLRAAAPDILLTQFTSYNSHTCSEFVAAVAPRIVIPHHMDYVWEKADYEARFERTAAAVAQKSPGTLFVTPEHGEWMDFSLSVTPSVK